MDQILWWHRPGVRIVCVDDNAWGAGNPGKLRTHVGSAFCIEEDCIYTIRWAEIRSGAVMLKLAEDAGPGFWVATRFRPLRETSIEQFRTLLGPTDADRERLIHETADAADRERADA